MDKFYPFCFRLYFKDNDPGFDQSLRHSVKPLIDHSQRADGLSLSRVSMWFMENGSISVPVVASLVQVFWDRQNVFKLSLNFFWSLWRLLSYSMVKKFRVWSCSGSIKCVLCSEKQGHFTVTITLMNVETFKFKTDRTLTVLYSSEETTHSHKQA